MHSLLNLAIGFLVTGITVLAVIFIFNRMSKTGGVSKLGTQPLIKSA
jgi:hypothetical protein